MNIDDINEIYQREPMSIRWRSSKKPANRCRNNIVKRIPVSCVEKPNTWNSCVANPGEKKHRTKSVSIAAATANEQSYNDEQLL